MSISTVNISTRLPVVDKDRVLGKIAELDTYLKEIRQILPSTFEAYKQVEKRRSIERLLQLSIECLIDACKIFVANLKLGIPSEENDLFEKLVAEHILTDGQSKLLQEMRAFRNILVHEYAVIDDHLVYEMARSRLKDLETIKSVLLQSIRK